MSLTELDRAHLDRAVMLGRRGWGRVHSNPMVGCVLVKEGTVVAEGWHEVYGGPHAETVALAKAGDSARGATAYVSLEPCRHEGKTSACTRALVRSGVRRVVFGGSDPGPESGGGGAELKASGVEVVGPVLDVAEARRENPAFYHVHRTSRPFVAVKLAMSLDSRLAEAPGVRTPLTGAEARREVHRLRAGFDAVLVGGTTALVDDPRLTVREDVPMRTPPVRVVLDASASLSTGAALFDDVATAPVWVFVREDTSEAELERLEGAGAAVHPVPGRDDGEGLELDAVLDVAWEAGLRSILCEGGGKVAGAFLGSGLAGRLYLFVAPRMLGPAGVPAFPGLSAAERGADWELAAPPARFGRDALLTLDLREA